MVHLSDTVLKRLLFHMEWLEEEWPAYRKEDEWFHKNERGCPDHGVDYSLVIFGGCGQCPEEKGASPDTPHVRSASLISAMSTVSGYFQGAALILGRDPNELLKAARGYRKRLMVESIPDEI